MSRAFLVFCAALALSLAAGGGTVYFPAGTYVTGSIHLRSNITLQLEPGSVIEASPDMASYDAVEPNQWDQFQEFGQEDRRSSTKSAASTSST